jgi:hypothetical protein
VGGEVNFLPAGKIPYSYFEQIVKFFRDVIELKKAQFEAHAWILWTAERGYFISIPKQTVSAAQVAFSYDDLPEGAVIVVDIHSHNSMGAFYSGTDDNNDKTGVYYSGVVGKLTATSYDFVFRFNMHENKLTSTLADVFDIPVKPEVTIPAEWMDQVEISRPAYVSPYSQHPGAKLNPNFRENELSGKKHQQNPQQIHGANRKHPGSQNTGKVYDFSGKNRPGWDEAKGGRSLWEENTSVEEVNRRMAAMDKEELGGEGFVSRFAAGFNDIHDDEGVIIDSVTGKPIALGFRGSLRQDDDFNQETAGKSKETSVESDEIQTQGALGDMPGEYDYYEIQYGELIAGAKEDADIAVDSLKDCDEALQDTIRLCFDYLSPNLRSRVISELNIKEVGLAQ